MNIGADREHACEKLLCFGRQRQRQRERNPLCASALLWARHPVSRSDHRLVMLPNVRPRALSRHNFARRSSAACCTAARSHRVPRSINTVVSCFAAMKAGQRLGLRLTIPQGCEPGAPLVVGCSLEFAEASYMPSSAAWSLQGCCLPLPPTPQLPLRACHRLASAASNPQL